MHHPCPFGDQLRQLALKEVLWACPDLVFGLLGPIDGCVGVADSRAGLCITPNSAWISAVYVRRPGNK